MAHASVEMGRIRGQRSWRDREIRIRKVGRRADD